jgi:hypothetical protein
MMTTTTTGPPQQHPVTTYSARSTVAVSAGNARFPVTEWELLLIIVIVMPLYSHCTEDKHTDCTKTHSVPFVSLEDRLALEDSET